MSRCFLKRTHAAVLSIHDSDVFLQVQFTLDEEILQ